jgi:ribosome-associated protein
MPLEVTPWLTIPDGALDERFVRASGPGGQNVNKVATAVQLRFYPARAGLSEEVRERLSALAGSRLTDEGVIVIDARAFRTQSQNRDEARERLADLIRRALVRPRRRHKTKPSRASQERRVDTKKRHGQTKRARSRRHDDD